MKPNWIIVGLGNPGPRFHGTRHNVGFRAIDRLAEQLGIQLRKAFLRPFFVARYGGAHSPAVVVKPTTYMNRSGTVLPGLIRRHSAAASRCIVVVDNMDLPVGTVRIKRTGGTSSHNGLKSIIEHVGTTDFPRVYIGVGSAPEGVSVIDHVLGLFQENEIVRADAAIRRAADSLTALVQGQSLDSVISLSNSADNDSSQ